LPCGRSQQAKKQRENKDLILVLSIAGRKRLQTSARQWGGRAAARSISAPHARYGIIALLQSRVSTSTE
jgi:hypothetical protein